MTSELTEDLIGSDSYAAALPRSKEFLPWHLPRKQFVRKWQWVEQVNRLLKDGWDETLPLTYIGLPGADLIDLRFLLREVCLPKELRLRYLGFNTAATPGTPSSTELNISIDELSRHDLVDARSQVRPDDFRSLGSEKSLAWKAATEVGPFDIVNLDLCDGLIVDAPNDSPTIYTAIDQLIGLQARRTRPWLLLLTMRVGAGHFHPDAFAKALHLLIQNLEECNEFREACEENLSFGSEIDHDWDNWDASRLLDASACAILKWILGLVAGGPASLSVNSAQSYRVDQASTVDDLVSIAMRVDPVVGGAGDSVGLSTGVPTSIDECAQAAKIPKRLAKRVAVDAILSENEDIRETCMAESEDLLRSARYDTAGYRQWASL